MALVFDILDIKPYKSHLLPVPLRPGTTPLWRPTLNLVITCSDTVDNPVSYSMAKHIIHQALAHPQNALVLGPHTKLLTCWSPNGTCWLPYKFIVSKFSWVLIEAIILSHSPQQQIQPPASLFIFSLWHPSHFTLRHPCLLLPWESQGLQKRHCQYSIPFLYTPVFRLLSPAPRTKEVSPSLSESSLPNFQNFTLIFPSLLCLCLHLFLTSLLLVL